MINESEQIFWLIDAQISEGRRDDVVAIMEKLVALTHASEPGALSYEWWTSEDGARLFIFERYADSDAALTHLANVGPHLGALMGAITMGPLMIFGPASEGLRAAGASLGASFAVHLGGFTR